MRGIFILLGLMLTNLSWSWGLAATPVPQEETGESANRGGSAAVSDARRASEMGFHLQDRQMFLRKWDSEFENRGGQLLTDQRTIWTSPARLHWSDADWLIPGGAVAAAAFLTDANFSRSLSQRTGTLGRFNDTRTAGVAALGAASGGLYLASFRTKDPHQRETAWLAGQAIFDTLVVTQGVKFIMGRERPDQANGQGHFFRGGNSFPSDHSAAAWAAAGILAHEYPGTMTKLLAYGAASTVSIASVGGKQHFPSDVLIAGGIGWLVSEYVYRAHHDPQLGGSAWNTFGELLGDSEAGALAHPGSTYVPLDSWVYAAFDRLAALGYLNSAYQGTRPWSRERCAQLLQDVEEFIGRSHDRRNVRDSQAMALLAALHREFAKEEKGLSGNNKSGEVESVYTRILSANGSVLSDGYHFGQTYGYDFGRPLRSGANFISGASASATYEHLFFYLSGEYQHAPGGPGFSGPEIQFIAERDKVAPPSGSNLAQINQFQSLDAYAGINVRGWQFSFGNQSLSWGPSVGGSLLLSNNAAPFPMLRISSDDGFEVPGLSRVFGAFHLEQFYGRLDGHAGESQPWIYGQKVSFKPFRSLELAYARTTLIGGSGHPLTANSFFKSLFGRVDAAVNSVPGDSRTAIEWTWRLPKLGNWVSFYGEVEDDDDQIPIQNLTKSVLRPGIYLPRLPKLAKWDVHFEWTTSTTPGRAPFQSHGHLNYWNLDYTSGYTNNGNLLGNTVGREGVTLQAWTRCWLSPRHTMDFSWKQSRVLSDYIPGGGKWEDYQAAYSWTSHSGLVVKSVLQFEHISSFPLLFSSSRNNVLASLEFGFLPALARHNTSSSNRRAPEILSDLGGASR